MRARQSRGNEVLAAALERVAERGLHERLLALADAADPEVEAGLKARRVKGLDPDGTLADNAERIVRVRLDELCGFMPTAADPAEVVALHDMRIAAKRLRYILEVTGPCFGPYAKTATRQVKELQDLLGEIHDCDVQVAGDGRVRRAAAGGRRRGAARGGRRRGGPRSRRCSSRRRTRASTPASRRSRCTCARAACCCSTASSSCGTSTSARASARGSSTRSASAPTFTIELRR